MTGEAIHVTERIVLAPATGRFVSVPSDEVDPTAPGALVLAGSPLASVVASGGEQAVTTPFTGVLAGILAHDGERVREGQPVAWLRVGLPGAA
ncbi:MAG: biotin/lipoyl-containing protein [Acidimicrobiales bacterium]